MSGFLLSKKIVWIVELGFQFQVWLKNIFVNLMILPSFMQSHTTIAFKNDLRPASQSYAHLKIAKLAKRSLGTFLSLIHQSV